VGTFSSNTATLGLPLQQLSAYSSATSLGPAHVGQ
jgi:hypothetical protein